MNASIHDYQIQSAAEVGACGTAGSFRAARRQDGQPVLLHRFRPGRFIIDIAPAVDPSDSPEWTEPFTTSITAVIPAAGSVYLVEPLPPCAPLLEAWRAILFNAPAQAPVVVAELLRQLKIILRRYPRQVARAFAENIVLTPQGTYGLLADSLPGEVGTCVLRPGESRPSGPASEAESTLIANQLLRAESELAFIRRRPILGLDAKRQIRAIAVRFGEEPLGESVQVDDRTHSRNEARCLHA